MSRRQNKIRKKLYLAVILLFYSCQSSQAVYVTEEIVLPKHYYHPLRNQSMIEKKEKRFVALYILGHPRKLVDLKDWQEMKDSAKSDPQSQNNRGVACIMLGDLSCAEEALLVASLSKHPLVLHNLQVLYKWQQSDLLIYK